MSNKHHNQSNKPVNQVSDEVKKEDVTLGVAPIEGDNSINETEESNADVDVSVEQDVSVADTQESESTEQEDGTATNDEEDQVADVTSTTKETFDESNDDTSNEESCDTDEDQNKTQKEDDVKPEETKTVSPEVKKVQAKDSGYFISLGEVKKLNMELVNARLKKAGVNSTSFIGDDLVVGPFATMDVCIVTRKKVISKGLKCRIIKK